MKKQPLVSIFMPTYFHGKYLEQAIESVLSQNIDFPIQIVISDDASQDNTPVIIKKYANKYDFIKYILNKKNIGLSANIHNARKNCDGKYITGLAGDDYYIDKNKLQKQVDFLENHDDYFAVCHRLEIRPDGKEVKNAKQVPELSLTNKEFTIDMFLSGKDYPTSGIMFRNPYITDKKDFFDLMPKISKHIDDLTDCILFLLSGKIFILSDAMIAYRVRVETKDDHNFNSINKGLDSYEKHIDLLNNLYKEFGQQLDLFYRYKLIVLNGLNISWHSPLFFKFLKIYKTIPKPIRNRCLLIKTICPFFKQRGINMINRLKKLTSN